MRRYSILDEVLGEGTYGTVCTALVKNNNKQYAFKRFEEGLNCNSTIRELATSQLLNVVGAEHSPKIYGFKLKKDQVGIFMEKADLNLWDWINNTSFGERKAQFDFVYEECLSGLQEVHACGLVHGDIKPGNFLVWTKGLKVTKIAICDFGMASSFPDQTDEYIYTYTHRAPEVWLDSTVIKASDVWSLGVCLLEICFGSEIFSKFDKIKKIKKEPINKMLLDKKAKFDKFTKHSNEVYKMVEWETDKRFSPLAHIFLNSFPKQKYYVPLKSDSFRPVFDTIVKVAKDQEYGNETVIHTFDILLRYLYKLSSSDKSGGPSDKSWDRDLLMFYAICSFHLASDWCQQFPYKFHDLANDFDVDEEEARDTVIDIIIKLKCLLYIPDTPTLNELKNWLQLNGVSNPRK